MSTFLLLTLVVMATIPENLACSCAFPDICNAEFVAAIFVEDDGTIVDDTWVYQVKVIRFLGADLPFGQINRHVVHTPTTFASCSAVILSKDTYYVITGSLIDQAGNNNKAIMFSGYCDIRTIYENKPDVCSFVLPPCSPDEGEEPVPPPEPEPAPGR